MDVYNVAIVPLIVGVVEVLKKVGLPSKFAAVASAALGIAIGLLYISPDDPAKGALVGLSLGLAASGLYSGAKNTMQGFTEGQ